MDRFDEMTSARSGGDEEPTQIPSPSPYENEAAHHDATITVNREAQFDIPTEQYESNPTCSLQNLETTEEDQEHEISKKGQILGGFSQLTDSVAFDEECVDHSNENGGPVEIDENQDEERVHVAARVDNGEFGSMPDFGSGLGLLTQGAPGDEEDISSAAESIGDEDGFAGGVEENSVENDDENNDEKGNESRAALGDLGANNITDITDKTAEHIEMPPPEPRRSDIVHGSKPSVDGISSVPRGNENNSHWCSKTDKESLGLTEESEDACDHEDGISRKLPANDDEEKASLKPPSNREVGHGPSSDTESTPKVVVEKDKPQRAVLSGKSATHASMLEGSDDSRATFNDFHIYSGTTEPMIMPRKEDFGDNGTIDKPQMDTAQQESSDIDESSRCEKEKTFIASSLLRNDLNNGSEKKKSCPRPSQESADHDSIQMKDDSTEELNEAGRLDDTSVSTPLISHTQTVTDSRGNPSFSYPPYHDYAIAEDKEVDANHTVAARKGSDTPAASKGVYSVCLAAVEIRKRTFDRVSQAKSDQSLSTTPQSQALLEPRTMSTSYRSESVLKAVAESCRSISKNDAGQAKGNYDEIEETEDEADHGRDTATVLASNTSLSFATPNISDTNKFSVTKHRVVTEGKSGTGLGSPASLEVHEFEAAKETRISKDELEPPTIKAAVECGRVSSEKGIKGRNQMCADATAEVEGQTGSIAGRGIVSKPAPWLRPLNGQNKGVDSTTSEIRTEKDAEEKEEDQSPKLRLPKGPVAEASRVQNAFHFTSSSEEETSRMRVRVRQMDSPSRWDHELQDTQDEDVNLEDEDVNLVKETIENRRMRLNGLSKTRQKGSGRKRESIRNDPTGMDNRRKANSTETEEASYMGGDDASMSSSDLDIAYDGPSQNTNEIEALLSKTNAAVKKLGSLKAPSRGVAKMKRKLASMEKKNARLKEENEKILLENLQLKKELEEKVFLNKRLKDALLRLHESLPLADPNGTFEMPTIASSAKKRGRKGSAKVLSRERGAVNSTKKAKNGPAIVPPSSVRRKVQTPKGKIDIRDKKQRKAIETSDSESVDENIVLSKLSPKGKKLNFDRQKTAGNISNSRSLRRGAAKQDKIPRDMVGVRFDVIWQFLRKEHGWRYVAGPEPFNNVYVGPSVNVKTLVATKVNVDFFDDDTLLYAVAKGLGFVAEQEDEELDCTNYTENVAGTDIDDSASDDSIEAQDRTKAGVTLSVSRNQTEKDMNRKECDEALTDQADDTELCGDAKFLTSRSVHVCAKLIRTFSKHSPNTSFNNFLWAPLWEQLKDFQGGDDETLKWEYVRSRGQLAQRNYWFAIPKSKGAESNLAVDHFESEEEVVLKVLQEIRGIDKGLFAPRAAFVERVEKILQRAVENNVAFNEAEVNRELGSGRRRRLACSKDFHYSPQRKLKTKTNPISEVDHEKTGNKDELAKVHDAGPEEEVESEDDDALNDATLCGERKMLTLQSVYTCARMIKKFSKQNEETSFNNFLWVPLWKQIKDHQGGDDEELKWTYVKSRGSLTQRTHWYAPPQSKGSQDKPSVAYFETEEAVVLNLVREIRTVDKKIFASCSDKIFRLESILLRAVENSVAYSEARSYRCIGRGTGRRQRRSPEACSSKSLRHAKSSLSFHSDGNNETASTVLFSQNTVRGAENLLRLNTNNKADNADSKPSFLSYEDVATKEGIAKLKTFRLSYLENLTPKKRGAKDLSSSSLKRPKHLPALTENNNRATPGSTAGPTPSTIETRLSQVPYQLCESPGGLSQSDLNTYSNSKSPFREKNETVLPLRGLSFFGSGLEEAQWTLIKELGGKIMSKISSKDSKVYGKLFFISHAMQRRKLKYVLASAMGVPMLHYSWLAEINKRYRAEEDPDAIKQMPYNSALFKSKRLPVGLSIKSGRYQLQKASHAKRWLSPGEELGVGSIIFAGLKLAVAMQETRVEGEWGKILSAAGATIVDSVSLQSGSACVVDAILVDRCLMPPHATAIPPTVSTCINLVKNGNVKSSAGATDVPVIDLVWAVQCIVERQRLSWDSSDRFRVDPDHLKTGHAKCFETKVNINGNLVRFEVGDIVEFGRSKISARIGRILSINTLEGRRKAFSLEIQLLEPHGNFEVVDGGDGSTNFTIGENELLRHIVMVSPKDFKDIRDGYVPDNEKDSSIFQQKKAPSRKG